MPKQVINSVKLGAFVLGGLVFLVVLLYMIGSNRNLFGSTYVLKARFDNIQGLVAGNNVRFSGIQAGTVKRVTILSDTVIEVTMIIDKEMLPIIRKNAVASIGTEGLVGNKVVNIFPNRKPAPLAEEGDMLVTKRSVRTEDILETLYNTNNDVAVIAASLKMTIQRINNSNALWDLLNDKSIPLNLRLSVANIRAATGKAGMMVDSLEAIVVDVKHGKGSLGAILTDTSIAQNLNEAIRKIKGIGDEADSLAEEINKLVAGIRQDVNSGKGPVNAVLRDTLMRAKIDLTLDNIQKGTEKFNQNMEALKHNYFFRGYYKKLEKEQKKEAEKASGKKN